jgi:nucleoside transporter
MMFFQYLTFAVWWVPLAAYLTNIGVSSLQKSLILSSIAIGCLLSPFVGMLADKYYAGQKVLAFLNLITAIFLAIAGMVSNPDLIFLSLLIAMFCYMPTWGLTNAIAMSNASSKQFPKIRVFGSLGWVASGLFSIIFVKILGVNFDGTNIPFYCGAFISLIAAVSNLFLPDTPPMGTRGKFSVVDALGLKTLKLMKDKNFSVFIIISFLVMIPFSIYWSYCSEFLLDRGFEYITITMNWGQLAEMFFMLLVPLSINKFGIKKTMVIGLSALLIRYLAFWFGVEYGLHNSFFAGILVHGIIFGFFFVGGQIYIDKIAPDEIKAQAQGFIFLVTIGLGLLVGNFVNGELINIFHETIANKGTYYWNSIWGITSLSSFALLLIFTILFKEKEAVVSELE